MKCIIIEDERPAQDLLKGYINKTPFLECIGIYENCIDVDVNQLSEATLLFVDIHLPELDGISFIRTLESHVHLIITTAFSDYAVEAFDLKVADYLLKPFSFERYYKAVSRVNNQIALKGKAPDDRIFIYADKTHYQISIHEILYIKAEVDYVRLHTIRQNYLILDSLRNWKVFLDNREFIQTHRSYIVNLSKISKLTGNQLFIEDKVLPIGKNYKDVLMNIIKGRDNS